MCSHDGIDLASSARKLVRRLIDGNDPLYGLGSMTVSIYDTAWMSMVAKPNNGRLQWLFPSSFQYLIDHQQHDGGWQSGLSDTDAILDSLAALLAICKHLADSHRIREGSEDLEIRKSRAIYFLETQFSRIDVAEAAISRGSHASVAELLQMLQGNGVEFSFKGKEIFQQTDRSQKSTHSWISFDDESRENMYFPEAQSGETVLDRMAPQKTSHSTMVSPASTAKYLMNCSVWDDEAESYLKQVVSAGNPQFAGGVPAKFPTTVSEVTSVITILLENGFTCQDLGARTLSNAALLLEECLKLDSGVIGSAPHTESDANNIARAISALCLLRRNVSPQGQIVSFETREYFKTFTHDRSLSFVTNCLILKALLDLVPSNKEQMSQIEKVAKLICNEWWTTNGHIENQINTSANYPILLMTDAFVRLIELWEQNIVPVSNDWILRDRVIISLFQALTRLLRSQNRDGSWENGCHEATAYAITALVKLRSLTSAPKVALQVTQAKEDGRRFIMSNSKAFPESDRVWKGKTTSGNSAMGQAYVLAAVQALTGSPHISHTTVENYFNVPLARLAIQTKYYTRQTWMDNAPEWLIQACLIESHLFLPQLRAMRTVVFPDDRLMEDRYFESIPFAWIAANSLNHLSIGAELMYQMMIVSFLGRQMEDYMENVVGEVFAGCSSEVEGILHGIFQESEGKKRDGFHYDKHGNETSRPSAADTNSDLRSVIRRFVLHILNHPYVVMASSQDQACLRSELLSFLLGRVSQIHRKERASNAIDTTAHSYTYAFLACLHGTLSFGKRREPRSNFLESPEQQYLATDMCRHMSIIGFMTMTAERQPDPAGRSVPAKPSSTDFNTDCSGHAFTRSVTSTSTASSVYEDIASPVSPISSVSSFLGSSPTDNRFTTSPTLQSTRPSVPIAQETLQLKRIIDHERRCLNLCLEDLLQTGVDQQVHDVMKLLIEATRLCEQIFQDANIGSSCQTTIGYSRSNQACELRPPPLLPKRYRGSVTAAQAASEIEPLANVQGTRQTSRSHEYEDGVVKSNSVPNDRAFNSSPTEREWIWNKKPSTLGSRTSRAVSETTRIERIMSEIDDFKLEISPKSNPDIYTSRRTRSESNAAWTKPKPILPPQKHIPDMPPLDVEAIKLAKVREETAQKSKQEAEKKRAKASQNQTTAKAAAQSKLANHLETIAMEDLRGQETRHRTTGSVESLGWVKAPPPVGLRNVDIQASKLRRASRLGGPRWKAPF